jgi:hypothetical protein
MELDPSAHPARPQSRIRLVVVLDRVVDYKDIAGLEESRGRAAERVGAVLGGSSARMDRTWELKSVPLAAVGLPLCS